MSLGTAISRLRAEKNMSQSDLAEALGVSRQSVSKWETDSSVPELDKLVRISQCFGVTLDELVRGETAGPAVPERPPEQPAAARTARPARLTVGILLLCMGFLTVLILTGAGSLAAGLLFASPLLLCGVICLLARRRAGLWCGWAVYLLADAYLRWAVGVNFRLTWLTLMFTPEMNYIRLAVGWGQLLGMVLLVLLTVRSFRKSRLEPDRRKTWILRIGWGLLLISSLLLRRWMGESRWFSLLLTGADWARLALLAALLTAEVCLRRTKTGKNES